ncbi:MAG TPA: hypothetical protein VFD00_08590 [Thermoclostridium sp.]|nr:hypothetical protein [Thermoclostridium sp.]
MERRWASGVQSVCRRLHGHNDSGSGTNYANTESNIIDYRTLEQITPSYEVLLNGTNVAGVCGIDGDTGEGMITITLDAPLNDGDTIEYTLIPGNTFAPGATSGEYAYDSPKPTPPSPEELTATTRQG